MAGDLIYAIGIQHPDQQKGEVTGKIWFISPKNGEHNLRMGPIPASPFITLNRKIYYISYQIESSSF